MTIKTSTVTIATVIGVLCISLAIYAQTRQPQDAAPANMPQGMYAGVTAHGNLAVLWRLEHGRLVVAATGRAPVAAAFGEQEGDDPAAGEQEGRIPDERSIEAQSHHQQNLFGEDVPQLNAALETMQICHNSPVPQGWIKTNDRWDPTRCGNPSSIWGNVWIITRYDNRPIGSVMDVCHNAPTPDGWVVIGGRWSPTDCGRPSSIWDNIKRIKRVN